MAVPNGYDPDELDGWRQGRDESSDQAFIGKFSCTASEARSWALPVAFRLTNGSRVDAEDLVQDVLIKLVAAKPPRERVGNARAYVLTALMRCWHDSWRGRQSEVHGGHILHVTLDDPENPLDAPDIRPGPAEQLVASEAWRRYGDVVEDLDLRLQEVVRLALDPMKGDFNLRSRQEIADMLGIPVGTVRRRLHEAVMLIRKQLTTLDTHPKRQDDQGEV